MSWHAIHTRDKLTHSHTRTAWVTLPFSVIVWLMSLLMFHMVHLWGYDLMYWSKYVCEALCVRVWYLVCIRMYVWLMVRGSIHQSVLMHVWTCCVICLWMFVFVPCVFVYDLLSLITGVIGIITLLLGGLSHSAPHLNPTQTWNLKSLTFWQVLWAFGDLDDIPKIPLMTLFFKASLDVFYFFICL